MDATFVIVIVCALIAARYVAMSCWARWSRAAHSLERRFLSGARGAPLRTDLIAIDMAARPGSRLHASGRRRAAMRVIWRGSALNRALDWLVSRGGAAPLLQWIGALEQRVGKLEEARPSKWERYMAQQGWAPSYSGEFSEECTDEEVELSALVSEIQTIPDAETTSLRQRETISLRHLSGDLPDGLSLDDLMNEPVEVEDWDGPP